MIKCRYQSRNIFEIYLMIIGEFMSTVVYLVRHSGPRVKTKILKTDNIFQVTNEKYILSEEGHNRAKKLASCKEFQNIDLLISSHYVRAQETAMWIADKTGLDIHIDSDFGERKVGISRYEDFPDGYYERQKEDPYYKVGDGENQIEVNQRMSLALSKVIRANKGKRIIIVSHSTAISFLLKNWCSMIKEDDYYVLSYKDHVLFNGKMHSPDLFKLEFDDEENLLNIEVIRDWEE